MKLSKYTSKNNCYFCGCSLKEYVEHIPKEYMEYDVQRSIVPNVYLDRLIDTIITNDNIPTITLVTDRIDVNTNAVDLVNFKILDGLQRTYRIKSIWESINLFNRTENKEEISKLSRIQLSKKYKEELKRINSDVKVLEAIINEYNSNGNIKRFTDYFNDNIQWFEIWVNLSPEEEIEKMLILNAGHKSMSPRHQLELLYLNVLPYLNIICEKENMKDIIREKQKSDTMYSKERVLGEYYFSHLISATISFEKCKPMTTNTDLIKMQQENNNEQTFVINYKYSLLEAVLKFLIRLDKNLSKLYGSVGVKWISRETVIVGVFAALGKYSKLKYGYLNLDVFNEFIEKINYDKNDKLKIMMYDESKNSNMKISKINIGNASKKAVMDAIYDFMSDVKPIEWDLYFRGVNHE
ncbi:MULTISPECIES: hypothetical protein [unclassified Clostridium]|uniref:hypothetical protein n=1 Tax=unclassified Clostridium TaxID=2614128 RepID=UPI00207AF8B6|nr:MULTISPECIES: hypothetical protein [unclassified Clostridium]